MPDEFTQADLSEYMAAMTAGIQKMAAAWGMPTVYLMVPKAEWDATVNAACREWADMLTHATVADFQ